jgi:hypothetical protein
MTRGGGDFQKRRRAEFYCALAEVFGTLERLRLGHPPWCGGGFRLHGIDHRYEAVKCSKGSLAHAGRWSVLGRRTNRATGSIFVALRQQRMGDPKGRAAHPEIENPPMAGNSRIDITDKHLNMSGQTLPMPEGLEPEDVSSEHRPEPVPTGRATRPQNNLRTLRHWSLTVIHPWQPPV